MMMIEAGAKTSHYQFLAPIQTLCSNPISSLQWSQLFSRDLIILVENPPRTIFGGLNGAGKLLYFTPYCSKIATFHPHIASQGKDFVASGLSGLENQSCLSRSREREDEESMRNYEFWSWGSPRQIMNSRSLQGKLSGACDARGGKEKRQTLLTLGMLI